MSILQTSMSYVSDPPKIDYTNARTEDAYYNAHQGYELNLRVRLRLLRRKVSRLLKFQGDRSPKPILKTNQTAL